MLPAPPACLLSRPPNDRRDDHAKLYMGLARWRRQVHLDHAEGQTSQIDEMLQRHRRHVLTFTSRRLANIELTMGFNKWRLAYRAARAAEEKLAALQRERLQRHGVALASIARWTDALRARVFNTWRANAKEERYFRVAVHRWQMKHHRERASLALRLWLQCVVVVVFVVVRASLPLAGRVVVVFSWSRFALHQLTAFARVTTTITVDDRRRRAPLVGRPAHQVQHAAARARRDAQADRLALLEPRARPRDQPLARRRAAPGRRRSAPRARRRGRRPLGAAREAQHARDARVVALVARRRLRAEGASSSLSPPSSSLSSSSGVLLFVLFSSIFHRADGCPAAGDAIRVCSLPFFLRFRCCSLSFAVFRLSFVIRRSSFVVCSGTPPPGGGVNDPA